MGKPDLKKGWVEVPVELLVEADWNYKDTEGDEVDRLLNALEGNFKRNGQIENILIRKLETGFYEVVNGNHRLVVAKRLKMKTLMSFNFGEISLAHAQRIALETNETKFKADTTKIAKILEDIKLEFDDSDLLTTLPYTDKDLEKFSELLNFDWEKLDGDDKDEGKSGGGSGGTGDFRKIIYDLPIEVADAFDEQVKRFKRILYPNDEIKDVSHVLPIEAMIQTLHQIPDSHIKGEE